MPLAHTSSRHGTSMFSKLGEESLQRFGKLDCDQDELHRFVSSCANQDLLNLFLCCFAIASSLSCTADAWNYCLVIIFCRVDCRQAFLPSGRPVHKRMQVKIKRERLQVGTSVRQSVVILERPPTVLLRTECVGFTSRWHAHYNKFRCRLISLP